MRGFSILAMFTAAFLLGHPLHHLGQVQDGELFRKLIEYPEFAGIRRIFSAEISMQRTVSVMFRKDRDLSALTVHRQIMSDRRLDQKTIKAVPNTPS